MSRELCPWRSSSARSAGSSSGFATRTWTGSCVVEHLARRRVVGEVVDLAAGLGDLVPALAVLDEHDEVAVGGVVRRELGGRRARQLGGARGELTQDLAQVEAR